MIQRSGKSVKWQRNSDLVFERLQLMQLNIEIVISAWVDLSVLLPCSERSKLKHRICFISGAVADISPWRSPEIRVTL